MKYLLLFTLLVSSLASGMTPDELRMLAGSADREKRQRESRVDPSNLDSLLPEFRKTPVYEEPVVTETKNTQPEPSTVTVETPESGTVEPTQAPAVESAPELPQKPVGEVTSTQPQVNASKGADAPVRASKYGNHPDPVATPATAPVKKPVSPKVKNSPHVPPKATTTTVPSLAITKPEPDKNVYIPPSRAGFSTQTSIVTDAVKLKQGKFGIRIGSWMQGKLSRNVTNSDPGLIKIILVDDVQGDRRQLPAGTELFAEKQYNQGTKRLDLTIIKAVLPDGMEININAIAYDSEKIAGLPGIVKSNTRAAAKSGLQDGLLKGAQQLSRSGTSDPASTIVGSAVGGVADAKSAQLEQEKPALYTIHVTSQSLFLQVGETF